MEREINENCPCRKANCPRHGYCFECVKWHWKVPPEGIIACQREKAARIYDMQRKEQPVHEG